MVDRSSFLRKSSLLLGLLTIAIPIIPLLPRSIQASGRGQCFPFLGRSPIPGELTVVSGGGEVISSSHPKLLKPGFGRSWKVSAGGYNPEQKRLMLVIKDRYFGLFLKQPLKDNQPIAYRAEPCGEVNETGMLLGRMLRPGLFFLLGQRGFEGALTKTGNRLNGTFFASSGFYLTANPGQTMIGKAKGRFSLQLKPGKDSRFPEPSPDAIRGLW